MMLFLLVLSWSTAPMRRLLARFHRRRVHRAGAAQALIEFAIVLAIMPLFLFFEQVWLAMALILAFWLLQWLISGYVIRPCPTTWPLLLLLILIPVSVSVTALPQTTRIHAGYLFAGVALYVAVVNWTVSASRLALLLGGALLAITGLAFLSPVLVDSLAPKWEALLPEFYTALRAAIPERVNPNVLAGTVALWIPVNLALLWQPLAHTRAWRFIFRVLAFGSLLVSVFAILAADSRGVWLALILSLPLFIVVRWPHLWLLAPAIFMAAGMTLSSGNLSNLLEFAFQNDKVGGLEARATIWARALGALQDFPITGIGMGGWERIGHLLYPYGVIGPSIEVPHVHNLLLQVGVDLGVVGLVAYLALIGLSFGMTLTAYRRFSQMSAQALAILALALFVSLSVLIVHGLVDAVSWGTRPAVMTWVLLGLATALFLLSERYTAEIPAQPLHPRLAERRQ